MYTKNQSIIISGGSRGLGLHFAEELLKNGNSVATFARSRTEAMDKLEAEYPGKFIFESLDATNEDGIKKFVRKVQKAFGSIDSLVNNAAIGQDQLLMHTDIDTIKRIIDINIAGPIILTRAVLKYMFIQDNGGNIVNIGSICGSRGYTGLSVYASSKGAIDAFTRSLARELGERNILVNSLAPGFFESEMSSVLLPEQLNVIKRRTPTRVLSNEDNIFKMLDLVLARVTNIQGQTMFIDGGITI